MIAFKGYYVIIFMTHHCDIRYELCYLILPAPKCTGTFIFMDAFTVLIFIFAVGTFTSTHVVIRGFNLKLNISVWLTIENLREPIAC